MNEHRDDWLKQEWVRARLEAVQSAPLLTEDEIGNLLFWSAGFFHLEPCPTSGEMCEVCGPSHHLWWDICNSLSGISRIKLQRSLRESDIPLPPHPGDDVDVVPTARV